MCVSVWGATCKIVLRGAMCKIMSIHVQPSTMLLLRRRLAESQLKEVEKNIPEPLPECNSTRLSQIVFVETKTYCAQMASTFHSVYIFDFFPTWVCQAFGLGNDTMETLPMDLDQAEQVVEAIRKSDDIKDIQDTEMVMDGEKKGGKDKNYYDPEKYQYPDNQLGLTPSPSPRRESRKLRVKTRSRPQSQRPRPSLTLKFPLNHPLLEALRVWTRRRRRMEKRKICPWSPGRPNKLSRRWGAESQNQILQQQPPLQKPKEKLQ